MFYQSQYVEYGAIEMPKIKRSPLGTYVRAKHRYERLFSRVSNSIYRGSLEERERLFRIYFDNENLIHNLQSMMRERGIEHYERLAI